MKRIVRSVFGSHLYGLSTPDSDKDFKEVYVPAFTDVLLSGPFFTYNESTNPGETKNTSNDIDVERFSLAAFIKHAIKGEMIAIDMLHTPSRFIEECSESWNLLRDNRKMFYSKNMNTYVGYIRRQVNKYNFKGGRLNALNRVLEATENIIQYYHEDVTRIEDVIAMLPEDGEFLIKTVINGANGKLEQCYEVLGKRYMARSWLKELIVSVVNMRTAYGKRAEEAANNENVDYKAVSHAYRAMLQIDSLVQDGDIKFPFTGTKQKLLMQIKTGQIPFTRIQRFLEEAYEFTVENLKKSSLPDTPDVAAIESLVLHIYKQEYNLNENIFDSRYLSEQ